MRMLDPVTIFVLLTTGLSLLVRQDFFFGVFLFMINYLLFKFIIKMMFTSNESDGKSIKSFIFLPAIFIKFIAIALVSYLVLVTLNGSPMWYVGGFGAGLGLFAVALLAESRMKKRFNGVS